MFLDVFGVYCIIVIDVFLGIIVGTLAGILAYPIFRYSQAYFEDF